MRRCVTMPILSILVGCGAASRPHEPVGPPLGATEARAVRALLQAAGLDPAVPVPPAVHRRLLHIASRCPCPCAASPSPSPSSMPATGPRSPMPGSSPRNQIPASGPSSTPRPTASPSPPLVARTLLRCDPGCERLRFAARSTLRGVASGEESDEEIVERLVQRFGPRTPLPIDLSRAACRGPARAGAEAVQLVVFSDFQCPYCAMGRVLVEVLERRSSTPLRVCFKHYPLVTMHAQARLAAQAAVAAQLQGKFWSLHDRLFAHQHELERAELVEHARAVGLDLPRFERDLVSAPVQLQVERDRAEALGLRVRGTPTFFVDGHEMTDPKSVPDFLDWIAEAVVLRRQGGQQAGGQQGGQRGGPVSDP